MFPMLDVTRHTVLAEVLVATHAIQSPAFVDAKLPVAPVVVADAPYLICWPDA